MRVVVDAGGKFFKYYLFEDQYGKPPFRNLWHFK